MQRYIIRRVGQAFLTLIAVSVIVFGLGRITGDPIDVLMPLEASAEAREKIREHWGLTDPMPVQYLRFVGNAARGDFGESIGWPGQDVLSLVLTRIRNTIELALVAIVFALVVAVPIGVMSAVHKDSKIDHFGKIIAILGQSLPHFWTGIVFMWIFAVHLRWLPTSGRGTWAHLIMPAIVIGWFQVAALMRLLRSSMLEALDSEYIKLARLKGLSETKLIWKHAARNALIAPMTYAGIMLAYLVVGSITTETVFAWPGVGQLVVSAVRARDFQVVQTIALIFAALIISANLVVDILYAYVDPRIRYDE